MTQHLLLFQRTSKGSDASWLPQIPANHMHVPTCSYTYTPRIKNSRRVATENKMDMCWSFDGASYKSVSHGA